MKREKLKYILLNYYPISTVNHILRGIRRPSYENILQLNRKYKVPFTAWEDIKSYLQDNNTQTKNNVKGNL